MGSDQGVAGHGRSGAALRLLPDPGNIQVVTSASEDWFAVRCVFATGWPTDSPQAYEERITLWRAATFDQAIEKAEADALEYARGIEEAPDTYLGIAQAYKFDGPPGEGVEVFSLIRRSPLAADDYINAFFDTGDEYQRTDPTNDA